VAIRHFARRGDIKALFAADQSVSGDWTFTGDVTFNGAATFASTIMVNENIAADFLGTSASRIKFNVSDAGTNEDMWDVGAIVSDDSFNIRTRTDADGLGNTAVAIRRTGTTVDEVELNATLLDFNGTADISGNVTFGAEVKAPVASAATPSYGFSSGTNNIGMYRDASTTLGFSTEGVRRLRINVNGTLLDSGTLRITEIAAAGTDVAGIGQLWVKNTTPCQLWFTDDAGTDTQIV
jgi:hypothetical protein